MVFNNMIKMIKMATKIIISGVGEFIEESASWKFDLRRFTPRPFLVPRFFPLVLCVGFASASDNITSGDIKILKIHTQMFNEINDAAAKNPQVVDFATPELISRAIETCEALKEISDPEFGKRLTKTIVTSLIFQNFINGRGLDQDLRTNQDLRDFLSDALEREAFDLETLKAYQKQFGTKESKEDRPLDENHKKASPQEVKTTKDKKSPEIAASVDNPTDTQNPDANPSDIDTHNRDQLPDQSGGIGNSLITDFSKIKADQLTPKIKETKVEETKKDMDTKKEHIDPKFLNTEKIYKKDYIRVLVEYKELLEKQVLERGSIDRHVEVLTKDPFRYLDLLYGKVVFLSVFPFVISWFFLKPIVRYLGLLKWLGVKAEKSDELTTLEPEPVEILSVA